MGAYVLKVWKQIVLGSSVAGRESVLGELGDLSPS